MEYIQKIEDIEILAIKFPYFLSTRIYEARLQVTIELYLDVKH